MGIISSSLNSKYQEFDEYGAGSVGQRIINGIYGLDNKPMTAYEALKAWCEKYLDADNYKVVPASPSYCATIYIIDCGIITYIAFDCDGRCCGSGTLDDDDMIDHINDYEGANNC